MPVMALPDGIDAESVVAATVSDDACAPEIRQGDLVIIARDHPWSDGDLVALIHKSHLLVRRAFHEGQQVLVVGADLSDRHTLAAQAILGRVVSSVRFH
ncbi:MAG: S24 family peptidase [Armatimonadota bacterium]